eukprot:CAMPEP_0179353284 /NCGR_PEP_ID=MMETSP0797-20121207/76246_1 /TAXON_ID=47934 /ORGANISM="Dinophysis acuminata, Strain DAEP01" /LENGTH=130 /DNA_ID=CAMNT_0021068331 /DNA_START=320 /DNA_END=710 /DNA_ORIENTATION=+
MSGNPQEARLVFGAPHNGLEGLELQKHLRHSRPVLCIKCQRGSDGTAHRRFHGGGDGWPAAVHQHVLENLLHVAAFRIRKACAEDLKPRTGGRAEDLDQDAAGGPDVSLFGDRADAAVVALRRHVAGGAA